MDPAVPVDGERARAGNAAGPAHRADGAGLGRPARCGRLRPIGSTSSSRRAARRAARGRFRDGCGHAHAPSWQPPPAGLDAHVRPGGRRHESARPAARVRAGLRDRGLVHAGAAERRGRRGAPRRDVRPHHRHPSRRDFDVPRVSRRQARPGDRLRRARATRSEFCDDPGITSACRRDHRASRAATAARDLPASRAFHPVGKRVVHSPRGDEVHRLGVWIENTTPYGSVR